MRFPAIKPAFRKFLRKLVIVANSDGLQPAFEKLPIDPTSDHADHHGSNSDRADCFVFIRVIRGQIFSAVGARAAVHPTLLILLLYPPGARMALNSGSSANDSQSGSSRKSATELKSATGAAAPLLPSRRSLGASSRWPTSAATRA